MPIIYTLVVSIFVWRLYKFFNVMVPTFTSHFIYRWLGWQIDVKQQYGDSWSVITGCTDGMGRAYAVELARRGITKFMLIARNPVKLQAVKEQLVQTGATDVETHVFDFAKDDWSKLPQKELSTYDIGILVNCAGMGPSSLKFWPDHELGLAAEFIRVNAESAVMITDIVVRNMVKRNKGQIVNVSSLLGYRPMFGTLTYSSSKACMAFMSESLNGELRRRKIKVRSQVLVPWLIATKLVNMNKSNVDGWVILNVEDFARQAVDVIGLTSMTAGTWQHDFLTCFLAAFPFTIMREFVYDPVSKIFQSVIDSENKNLLTVFSKIFNRS